MITTEYKELNVILAENLDDYDKVMAELGELVERYERNEGYAIEYKIRTMLNNLNIYQKIYGMLG